MADAKRTLRECLDERLKEGRARGLERRPPLLDMAGEGPVVHMGGRAFLNFTLNDGLGLASSPEWRAEVGECFAAFPPSASASRLAGGRSRITEEAEQAVAAYFGFDECLFLPSGYQGNLACAMALIHAGQPSLWIAGYMPASPEGSYWGKPMCGHMPMRIMGIWNGGSLPLLPPRYSRW